MLLSVKRLLPVKRDAVNAIVAHVFKDGNSLLVLHFVCFSLFLATEICFLKLKKLIFGVISYFTCTLIEQEKCVPF